jgi:hypothetical protein
MGATATRMTAAQYFAVTVEGDHKQLVDGAIVVTEARPIHALLQVRLLTALRRLRSEAGLSPATIYPAGPSES